MIVEGAGERKVNSEKPRYWWFLAATMGQNLTLKNRHRYPSSFVSSLPAFLHSGHYRSHRQPQPDHFHFVSAKYLHYAVFVGVKQSSQLQSHCPQRDHPTATLSLLLDCLLSMGRKNLQQKLRLETEAMNVQRWSDLQGDDQGLKTLSYDSERGRNGRCIAGFETISIMLKTLSSCRG